MRAALLALILAAAAAAQSQFEVVSIHQTPPGLTVYRDVHFTPIRSGGQYVDEASGLWSMIAFAYDVKNAANQLLGLPDWAKNRRYAISAKAGPGFPDLSPAANREQVRLMLRAMLADRFHLAVHQETREEDVLILETARSGFKFKEVPAPEPPARENPIGLALGDTGGRMIANKSTVAGIAGSLALWLRRPVLDRTGLTGYYDFDIKWTSPNVAEASESLGASGLGLLVSAVRDQLGLQLRKAKGPVEYWIVDRVEPPTEN